MNHPKVVVLILNWNGGKDTIECLDSVLNLEYPLFQIVVVDNGSTDNSLQLIRDYLRGELDAPKNFLNITRTNYPLEFIEVEEEQLPTTHPPGMGGLKLIVLKNRDNWGFSGGNNRGIKFINKYLDADYILLLNNDTLVHTKSLQDLTAFAQEQDKLGMVGPKVLYYDEPHKISFQGGMLNLCTARIKHYQQNEGEQEDNSPVKLDFITGCCMLLTGDMMREVGLLDEDFFLFMEDVDWCVRARRHGYKVYYLPTARIWHKESATTKKESASSLYYGIRNNFLLIKKHCPHLRRYISYVALILDAIIYSFKFLLTGRIKEFKSIIRALNDGLNNNYGP